MIVKETFLHELECIIYRAEAKTRFAVGQLLKLSPNKDIISTDRLRTRKTFPIKPFLHGPANSGPWVGGSDRRRRGERMGDNVNAVVSILVVSAGHKTF